MTDSTYTGKIISIDYEGNIGRVSYDNDKLSSFNDRNCYASTVKEYNIDDEVEFEIKRGYPFNLRHIGTTVEKPILKEYHVDWFELKNDLISLYPEVKDLKEKEIYDSINKYNKGRKEIVFLKNGLLSDKENSDIMFIPTSYSISGKRLYLCYRKQEFEGGAKFIYSCVDYQGADISVLKCSDMLFAFSSFEDFDYSLEHLKKMAINENWGKGQLKNYIKYTFAHEFLNENIAKSSDGCAAFNTGLTDRHYNPIYAVFETTKRENKRKYHELYRLPKYEFKCFSKGDKHEMTGLDKPEKTAYFDDNTETVINVNWRIECNEEHILKDRLSRFPLSFFKRAMWIDEVKEILLKESSDSEKYEELSDFLESDSDAADAAFEALRQALQQSIEAVRKRLKYNFRVAVPCFNPEKNQYSFLLPVSFNVDPRKADVAAMVSIEKTGENQENKQYRVETILPLDWAYLDARLVCSPESSWLNPNSLSQSN